MKKIIKEINVYNFNELSEESKQKVKEEIAEILVQNKFDFLQEDLKEFLEFNYKLNDFIINYSFTYSQGDGCCFYNKEKSSLLSYTIIKNRDIQNANAFEKYIIENERNINYDLLLDYLNSGYKLYIEKSDYRYSHCNTCDINYEYYYDDNYNYEAEMENFIEDLCNLLKNEVYDSICDEMEKLGYSYYEVSEEELEYFIDSMEYEFLEDGEIYRG